MQGSQSELGSGRNARVGEKIGGGLFILTAELEELYDNNGDPYCRL